MQRINTYKLTYLSTIMTVALLSLTACGSDSDHVRNPFAPDQLEPVVVTIADSFTKDDDGIYQAGDIVAKVALPSNASINAKAEVMSDMNLVAFADDGKTLILTKAGAEYLNKETPDSFSYQVKVTDGKTSVKETIVTKTAPIRVPVNITFAHINDHHSHLAEEKTKFVFENKKYEIKRGGFPRIKQLFDDMESKYGHGNFLKLHAGDAVTGTPYYSFYKGNADADLMNTVCFDAFALGNHEFDDGDGQLKHFLDYLHKGKCQTPVLAANVKPAIGTPLAPKATDDYLKPYIIKETKKGVKVGIIGLDIASKTKASSQPLDTTEFLDETVTAQNYINELKNKGVEHIVLLTHYTYKNDQKLAKSLTDVDVILGGDSHTLLGDFSKYQGIGSLGDDSKGSYPTIVKNKEGDTVCIGQAWEYSKAFGLMEVKFNKEGSVDSCSGSAIMPIGSMLVEDTGKKDKNGNKIKIALSTAESRAILDKMIPSEPKFLQEDIIIEVTPNPEAVTALNVYADKLDENMAKQIGTATDTLCLVRVPGTSKSADQLGCKDSASLAQGSDVAQVVAKAFLDGSLRADFSLQNAGGVREPIAAGSVTNNIAYTLLPFSNTLVNFDITGQQVLDTLEAAISNYMENDGSDGSHPYADGLRWNLDLSKAKGQRISALEVRDRKTGTWSAIDLNKTYVMVTNDYIGRGKDGYTPLGNITKDNPSKVEDTKLLYTQSFIDYVEKVGSIKRPNRDDYSHKSVITKDGVTLK